MTQERIDKIGHYINQFCEKKDIDLNEIRITSGKTIEYRGTHIYVDCAIFIYNKQDGYCVSASGDASEELFAEALVDKYLDEKKYFMRKQEKKNNKHPFLSMFK